MNRSALTDADLADALWNDLFKGKTGSSNTSAPRGVYEDSMAGYSFGSNTGLPKFNAYNDTAFTPTPTKSMETFTDNSYPHVANAWPMRAQRPVAPQLLGYPHMTVVSPYAANSVAAIHDPVVSPGSSVTPPGSQDEPPWPFGQGQSIYLPTFSSGAGSEGVLVAPKIGANISVVAKYPVGSDTNHVGWPIPSEPATSAPTAVPAKRRHDEVHRDEAPVVDGYEMPSHKRVRAGKPNGILKAARSAPRTRHKPADRIPNSKMNNEPKEARRGAERLATPNSQRIHHQSLLGPSLDQGWAVEAADGQLIWVEGIVEDVVRGIDNTVPQRQQEEEEYINIPTDFKTEYQALLVATQAERARGAVREIKCRLCPDAKFKKWGEFKRHCECTEAHPLTIDFCTHCGDYFARSDSRKRHCENPPAECLRVTPEEGDAKQIVTKREHDEFMGRLQRSLTTGEDIGTSFSKKIKNLYPGSSKKRRGSRE